MKMLGLLAAVAGAVLVIHRFKPEMGEVCEHVFDKMPDKFPPKQMFLNIVAIREQNARILSLLEEHIKAAR